MKSKGKKSPGPLGRVIFSRVIFITILHYLSLLSFSLFMRSRLFFSQRLERSGGRRACVNSTRRPSSSASPFMYTHKAHYTISLSSVSPLCHGSIGSESAANSTVFPSTRLCNCASITKNRRLDGAMGNKKTTNLGSLFFQKRKIIP